MGEILSSDYSMLDRYRTTVTSSTTTSGAYGDWTQIIPSCPFNASGFVIYFDSFSDTQDYYIDVGVNENGTIYPILEAFRVYSGTAGYTYRIGERVYVPLVLPKGKEILVRCRTNGLNDSIFVAMYPITKSFTAIGGLSKWNKFDVSVTTDGYSEWVEVTPSIPFHVRHVIVSISTSFDTTLNDEFIQWKLGYGAVNSEKSLFPISIGVDIAVESTVDYPAPRLYSFPVQIPKGERLVITQDTNNANTNRYDYSIYLFG